MYNDDDVKNKQKPWPTCQAPELKHVYWYIYIYMYLTTWVSIQYRYIQTWNMCI